MGNLKNKGGEMMIRIAICDDETTFLNEFKGIIVNENPFDGNYHIDLFTSGIDLINKIENQYDIIFLDIQMPGLDGNETSERLREVDKDVVLIFTTAISTPMPKIFKVKPFRYFVKPINEKTISLELSEIWKEVTDKKETVIFNCTNGTFSLKIHSVLYLAISHKYVEIVTDTQTLYSRDNLSKLSQQLTHLGFAFSHKSYLVNLNRIFSIQKYKIILDNGSDIPISQPKAKQFKKDFTDYAKSKKWGDFR